MRTPSEAIADLLARPPMPAVAEAASRHPGPVVLVGGALRDALLGRPPADLDIAVGGNFEAFVEAFTRSCGRRPVSIGDDWRDTRRTRCGDIQVDVARLLGGVAEDLSRRDFTINAMAVSLNVAGARLDPHSAGTATPTGLIDLHGGLDDLAAGILRMLSDTALTDDPLRLLRAARYVATLPGFATDEQTATAIRERAGSLEGVAAERIQTEWGHLLGGDGWAAGVRLAFRSGLGSTVVTRQDLDPVEAWEAFEAATTERFADAEVFVARLAALLCGDAAVNPDETHRRLVERRWPAALARAAARTASWASRLGAATSDGLASWATEDHEAARRAVRLAAAIARRANRAPSPAVGTLEDYSRRAVEPLWVKGADLVDWGMQEGPRLGAVLGEATRGQVQRRWDSAEGARSWARREAAREVSAPQEAADV